MEINPSGNALQITNKGETFAGERHRWDLRHISPKTGNDLNPGSPGPRAA